ncbi:T9SS type B sorting domain-containing protein [Flavobacterium psychrophilum]|nr:T9SS type B sorting domain-containing protein [Flavobacterium psychrophilum]
MKLLKNVTFFIFLLISQTIYSQNDCTDALTACGNNSYTDLYITGSGVNEISNANTCDGNETNSLWIKVNIRTAGTLGFTLTPQNTNLNVDFDFYIFGPTATCGNLGNAIRCSTTNPAAVNATNNTTGMNGTETDTSEGPGANGNSFIKWLDVQIGETYYIVIDRFDGNSNFSINWTGTATFNQPPTINTNPNAENTLNIEKCDSDNVQDNKTSFNFTQNATLAIGNQNGVTASFHTSLNDATVNANPITNSTNFRNTSNPQNIYIRLTNIATKCFTTSGFSLHVTPFDTNNPNDLKECDLNNDGFVTYTLSANNATLINGNSDIAVSYHPNNNDLITLANNYTNQTAFTNETIWAKIKNTVTGCYAYKSLNLILNKIPPTNPTTLIQCDLELFPDGLTTFNLNEANAFLTNNDTNLSTKFYLNPTDAQSQSNSIAPNFQNTTNPQVISVRVINNTTGCYSITTLTLKGITNPTRSVTLEECDDDDITTIGFTKFNLSQAGFEISGNTATYFQNLNDALLEEHAIATLFTNTQANNQTIYARIENGNNCKEINLITLKVNPLPSFEIQNNEILCLNNPTKPVNLIVKTIDDPNLYSYKWTPNEQITQNINTFLPGNYAVEVENKLTHCKKSRSITITPSETAIIKNITITDLVNNNTAVVNISGTGDYVYSIDEEFGPFQESNIFSNVTAGIHQIYVKDLNGCGTAPQEINVLGVPKYFTPNGDGIHDYWNVEGITATFNANTTITIFDRFGKLIKQISPLDQGWDGTDNGQKLPATDYWYTIQFENGKNIKGNFSLKR